MGIIDRLFRRQLRPEEAAAAVRPVEGSPLFKRAVDLQISYWTHDPDEQAKLAERAGELDWPERLRFHHLLCMARAAQEQHPAPGELLLTNLRHLLAPESPYRPRAALVWQGQLSEGKTSIQPDSEGVFCNGSLTHLGALAVFDADKESMPTALRFIGFAKLAGMLFAQSAALRPTQLFYDNGSEKTVYAPALYGLTWQCGDDYHRSGTTTGYFAHVEDESVADLEATGIGIGQQDFMVKTPCGTSLISHSSVCQITFPLDMADPSFESKARARGIDPAEVRRSMP